MSSSDSNEQSQQSTHLRVILVGAVVPTAIALAAALLMVSWLQELPDPIAVHWEGKGANGFGPALPFILAPLVISVLFSIFAVSMSWRTAPSGQLIYNQKILLATSVWLSTFLSVGFAGSVSVQRGLTDAHDAPDVGAFMAAGVGAGIVLAGASWFALPKGASSITEAGKHPKPVDLRGDERLSWSHTARLGNAALTLIGVSLAVAIGGTIFASMASRSSTIIAVIVLVFVAVLVITNTWWRVSADRRGFTVRGALGWPSKRIALDDIRTVQVVEVTPARDFGGYGWRWTVDGRSGVILRAGPAIEVTAASGKRFVVTVDDAETGAGVIAALLSHQVAHEA